MNEDPLKSLWRAQELPPVSFPVEELRRNAQRFQRRIRLRNALEYAACVLVVLGFARYFVIFPSPLMRAGSVLIIIGTLLVAWQLRRRASNVHAPEEMSTLDFHRQQLVRQRDALRTVWVWYIAPLVPGMAVFRWGVETELGDGAPFARGIGANLAIVAVLIAIFLLNLYTARKLQRKIDQLNEAAH